MTSTTKLSSASNQGAPAMDAHHDASAHFINPIEKGYEKVLHRPDPMPVIQDETYSDDPIETPEVLEESLSLQQKEIDLIRRALSKHRGKRKNAATELGISERTLYRKIKEYNIE